MAIGKRNQVRVNDVSPGPSSTSLLGIHPFFQQARSQEDRYCSGARLRLLVVYEAIHGIEVANPAVANQSDMASWLRRYNVLLMNRPMVTQCVTAAVLFGGGDVIAQQAVERRGGGHDFVRTARQTFFGGVLFAPIMTKWYGLLNRMQFATPTKALVYRVYLDQLVLSPVAVVYFYSCMTLLEGRSIHDAAERVKTAYVSTLVRNWSVFVPTQIVNFALVPAHLRFVFMGTVSLFWNTYLSYANMEAQRAISGGAVEKDSEGDVGLR